MMTVKEAAKRLGISRPLAYALCAAGKIKHERHGLGRGTIRISEEALEEYREGVRVEHPSPTPPKKRRKPGELNGAFKNLDSGRLLDAWQAEGAVASPSD